MILTIPDRHLVLLHKLHLAIVHSTNVALLFFCSLESTDTVRESKATVVMDGVYRVVPYSVEACEVHAESVSRVSSARLQKDNFMDSTHVLPSKNRIWSGSIFLIAGTIRS